MKDYEKKYSLIAMIPTVIGNFDTLDEAEASKSTNIESDRETNAQIEYQIILNEDHEANLLKKYNIIKLVDQYLGNKNDLRNFFKELNQD